MGEVLRHYLIALRVLLHRCQTDDCVDFAKGERSVFIICYYY